MLGNFIGEITLSLKHRNVSDDKGNRVEVLLDASTFDRVVNQLEELDDIRAYDQAKAVNEHTIPFKQAMDEIERGEV